MSATVVWLGVAAQPSRQPYRGSRCMRTRTLSLAGLLPGVGRHSRPAPYLPTSPDSTSLPPSSTGPCSAFWITGSSDYLALTFDRVGRPQHGVRRVDFKAVQDDSGLRATAMLSCYYASHAAQPHAVMLSGLGVMPQWLSCHSCRIAVDMYNGCHAAITVLPRALSCCNACAAIICELLQ